MARFTGQTDESTKASTYKTSSMGTACLPGKMAEDLKATGKKEDNMEKDESSNPTEEKK